MSNDKLATLWAISIMIEVAIGFFLAWGLK
jgi:hypothetical protein